MTTTPNTTTIDPAIMKRLVSIKALMEGATNEAEAVAASTMLQRHLLKYNLQENEISMTSEEKAATGITTEKYAFGVKTKWYAEWRSNLMRKIAKYHFCHSYFRPWDLKVTLVGTPENIAVCIELHKYLSAAIDRLRKQTFKALDGYAIMDNSQMQVWGRAFCQGAIDAVGKAMYKERQKNVDELKKSGTENVSALVLVKENDVKEWVAENLQLSKGRNTKNYHDTLGYAQGYKAGSGISLNKQIKG